MYLSLTTLCICKAGDVAAVPDAFEQDAMLEPKTLGQRCLKNCLVPGTEAQILSRVRLSRNRPLRNL